MTSTSIVVGLVVMPVLLLVPGAEDRRATTPLPVWMTSART